MILLDWQNKQPFTLIIESLIWYGILFSFKMIAESLGNLFRIE